MDGAPNFIQPRAGNDGEGQEAAFSPDAARVGDHHFVCLLAAETLAEFGQVLQHGGGSIFVGCVRVDLRLRA